MKKRFSTIKIAGALFFGGIFLVMLAGGVRDLDSHLSNPLAIRGSGYGMTLARLSQDTVDRVWHMGVEQNSHHHHPNLDNHCDCASCRSEVKRSRDPRLLLNRGKPGPPPPPPSLVERAHDFINGLQHASNQRSSKYSLSERHKLTAARQIEKKLRNSYLMDPTNYGVYEAYYLFLTTHDLGGATAESRDRAREISHQTISKASFETENPEALLTAAAAALNLFFLDLQEQKATGGSLSQSRIERHSDLIAELINRYESIRAQRMKEGTWNAIGEARRAEIAERARFARKTHQQFAAMLKRFEEENTN